MVYRYTLPAQRSPYACQPRELSLRSQTISNAMASPPTLKRASLYTQDPISKVRPLKNQPWIQQIDKENVKVRTYPVSPKDVVDEDMCQYDPADPATWGIRPLPPIPSDDNSNSHKAPSIMSRPDDDAAMLLSPILQPYTESADVHNLAQLIGDNLRIDDEHPDHAQHRTTSSSYHDPESEPSRVDSPISNGHVNILTATNLAKFGKTNDRLSNLRSGSPSSATGELLEQDSNDSQNDPSSVVKG